eukprot:767059-Hanusia_phi.AAC.1
MSSSAFLVFSASAIFLLWVLSRSSAINLLVLSQSFLYPFRLTTHAPTQCENIISSSFFAIFWCFASALSLAPAIFLANSRS